MANFRIRHSDRLEQVKIYTGKLFRMFVFQNDWKLLPMAAIIAGAVAFVTGKNMFKTMEGTAVGALALTCICLWNGFFNSIQVICRERPIIKREHRAGLHISAYIFAHIIYQAFLCVLQSVITLGVCMAAKMAFPSEGFLTDWFLLDMGITLFLITFTADMLSLLISSFVKNTTAAMTVMPFLLILQLLFSGTVFPLSGAAAKVEDYTITKWGMDCICAQSDYNSQPMVSAWNQMFKFRNAEINGQKPIKEFVKYMEDNDLVETFEYETAQYNLKDEYEKSVGNIIGCWMALIIMSIAFIILATISLEFIDHDKR